MAADLLVVLTIVGLLVANGVFVAAEFAMIAAQRSTILDLAAAGSRRASLLVRIQDDPVTQDRYVATAQVGITLASLGLGMYGEASVAEWLKRPFAAMDAPPWLQPGSAATILSLVVLTYLHIVVGEMVPKSLALAGAEKTALRLSPLMVASEILFFPLVRTLNAFGNAFLRIFGFERERTGEHVHSPEELQLIVEESTQSGLLRRIPGRVLQELIEFSELSAHEVMVPRVHLAGVPVGCSTERLREIILDAPHTRYPVFHGDLDHILGLVHMKDLLRIILEQRPTRATDARPVPRVPETMTLDSVLDVMRKDGAQAVVVMDEHGGTSGMITMEDLFEEVVGDIDEGADTPEIRREGQDKLRVLGTARLADVGEALDRELDHEDVDTVSGLVLAILERPPTVGDAVHFGVFRFQVTEVEGHGVAECVVTIEAPPPPPKRDSSGLRAP